MESGSYGPESTYAGWQHRSRKIVDTDMLILVLKAMYSVGHLALGNGTRADVDG